MSFVAHYQGNKATLTKVTPGCGVFLLISLLQLLSAKSYTYDPVEGFNAKSFQELTQDDSWTKMDLRRAGLADKDMVHLANLQNLEELWLDSHRITSEGYQVLSQLPKLRILGVYMTSGKETEELLGYIKNCRLKELDLRNCRDFTGKGLEQLVHKKDLKSLNLSCFRGILNDAGMASLEGLTGLQHLDLSNHKEIRKGISVLEGMTELETLNLYECVGINDQSATQAFSKLTKLKELNMGFCWAHKGHGLVFPSGLTHLNLIESKNLTDAAFQDLPCRETLVEVNLFQCLPLTDKGISVFTNLPNLQHFNVGCIRALTNKSLKYVGTNKNLTHLTICDNDQFTDEGLQHLSELKKLQVLNLWHTKGLTGSGFQHLSSMQELTELNLADCHNLQDPHFSYLTKLGNLRNLYLDNSPISDKAIQHLKDLKLSELTLSGCENLTNKSLQVLANLQTLQYLDISNCMGFSDIELLKISKALPDCEIVK